MREVVAAQIGTLITNHPETIILGIKHRRITGFLYRQEMKFMAALDLGKRWENLAKSPTLFLFDDEIEKFPQTKSTT